MPKGKIKIKVKASKIKFGGATNKLAERLSKAVQNQNKK